MPPLEKLQHELRCTLDEAERRDDLKLITHLIGDLHQPLYTVKELGGGNGILVTVNFRKLKEPPSCAPVSR